MVQARKLGSAEADILSNYPTLNVENLTNALAYYRAHEHDIEQQIIENENERSTTTDSDNNGYNRCQA
ncbi:MAG: hypothetical protein M3Q45_04445 [Chloroflexota bacterium]|nr:hypothetical protein [Chloroflexota bacterium]